jgi:hypothetical protein
MKKMKTHNSLHFAILVPHPNLAGALRGQSRFLFASGMNGAWSFPQAAPLARLKRPLSEEELRDLAAALREATLPKDGKITLGRPILVPCPGFYGFFGPTLDLAPPPLPSPAVLYPLPALVLCVALAAPAEAPLAEGLRDIPPANPGFFRAALVTNLTIRPLNRASPAEAVPAENYSLEWRLGKPRWLPSPRNAFRRRIGQDGV